MCNYIFDNYIFYIFNKLIESFTKILFYHLLFIIYYFNIILYLEDL